MNHTAFFEQVKKGNIQPVYLMEGTEEYIKQQAVRRAVREAAARRAGGAEPD